MDRFLKAALDEAKKGYFEENGIPIGSVLVLNKKIIGRGHNRRIQKQSAILHAEMDAIENAGRLKSIDYKKCILYTTLSPCAMCAGVILLYKIPKVVIGENITFKGEEEHLRSRGVQVEVMNSSECYEMMQKFIKENSELWYEDIGE